MNDWIPVEDRLPAFENEQCSLPVLVTDGKLFSIGCRWLNGGKIYFRSESEYARLSITHWMPLPELPSEDTAITEYTDECVVCKKNYVECECSCECKVCVN